VNTFNKNEMAGGKTATAKSSLRGKLADGIDLVWQVFRTWPGGI